MMFAIPTDKSSLEKEAAFCYNQPMDWIEVTIQTTSEGVEPVSGLILMAEIPGLVVDDPKDVLDFLADRETARWDYADDSLLGDPDRETVIRVYVGDNEQGRRQWAELAESLDRLRERDTEKRFGSMICETRKVKEEDWANNWKAYFTPFPVGEKLVVKPTWERWENKDDRAILEIDPGSSFGTGQHHTTRMCLEFLERLTEPGIRLLDIGCGSGILMIAGLLLGAGYAIGVDVEENAVSTADENLRQNGIKPDQYALFQGDLRAESALREKLGKADLITANIVADVIILMAPYFSGLLKGDGKLLVSGIIGDRREEVLRRLDQEGFVLEGQEESGEWYAMLFRHTGS